MNTREILHGAEGFVRIGASGMEAPGYAFEGRLYSIESMTAEIDGAFLAQVDAAHIKADVAEGRFPEIDAIDAVRIGAPIARPGKIVCVGLNFHDHAVEIGADIPKEPILFGKASDTIVGPTDALRVPPASDKIDWEIELGIVIGRYCLNLSDDAAAYESIAGFVASNDVSARDFQMERGGQWFKGKSWPTFNPLGPVLRPRHITDPADLKMELWVNDVVKQDSSTAQMIFDAAFIVRYVSQFMALEPGDLINTGTPAGVGLGRDEPGFLMPGDVIDLAISTLGSQRTPVELMDC